MTENKQYLIYAPPGGPMEDWSHKLEEEPAVTAKAKREPRPAWTYRAARKREAREQRKAMLRHTPDVIEEIAPAAYLNRSDKWPRAMSYGYARENGPSKEPVR